MATHFWLHHVTAMPCPRTHSGPNFHWEFENRWLKIFEKRFLNNQHIDLVYKSLWLWSKEGERPTCRGTLFVPPAVASTDDVVVAFQKPAGLLGLASCNKNAGEPQPTSHLTAHLGICKQCLERWPAYRRFVYTNLTVVSNSLLTFILQKTVHDYKLSQIFVHCQVNTSVSQVAETEPLPPQTWMQV